MAIGRVVYKHSLAKFSIANSEIFEEVAFLKGAVLSVHSMRNVFFFRIQIIENDICVGSTTGCEDDDLCKL